MKRILTIIKTLYRDFCLNFIASSIFIPSNVRYIIYKLFGIDAKRSRICPRCFLGGSNLTIGKHTFINYGCFFDTSEKIIIGNNCNIAFQVTFDTSTHKILPSSEQRAGEGISKPIKIEDGCWIGANVTILPGVIIEQGCIIAAGSVVTKNCKANGLYAGIPAIRKKDLNCIYN